MSPLWVNSDSSWAETIDGWVYDNGWTQCDEVWEFDDGSWHTCFKLSKPSDLTVTWSSGLCGFNLEWDADENNQQDIYRCSGTGCSPQSDGSVIDTVAATVESAADTAPDANSGDWGYQIVSIAGESNVDSDTAGSC